MGATLADYAVSAVAAWLAPTEENDGFVGMLRSYETASSRAENSLPDPVAYVSAFATHDTRSPLILVYERGVRPARAGLQNGLFDVDVDIGILYTHDADAEVGESIARGYVSAIVAGLADSPTLGDRVVSAVFIEADRALSMVQQASQIRHVRAVSLVVQVQS